MKYITLNSSAVKTLTTLALTASSLFAGSALANNGQDNGWVQTHTAQETYLDSRHLYCDHMDLESAKAECEADSECNGFNFRGWDHTVCFKAVETNANGKTLPVYHQSWTGWDVRVQNPQEEIDLASYCGEHMGWDSDAELCIIQPEYVTAAAQAVSAAAQCQNDLDRHHSELTSMETQRKQSEQQIQDSTSSIAMDFTTNYLRIVDNTGTSTPLTTCNQDDEFESNSPSPISDRVCTSLTTCDRPNWDQSIAPTATTDRVCGLESALQLRYCARIGFCSTAHSMGYTSTNWQNAYHQDFGAEACSGIGKNVLQEGIERAKRGQDSHSRGQFTSPN